ncbi:META domain-containing protein [Thiocapsa sp.]|uniref:META domain-containing protein n=1 Tax=Thiocapsa sp. TaxID=2024551 RepID=UPI002CE6759A|nr:META domain-containing protein [Thiocapsa sp.]HSO83704.1 META domain-containing protein [Thiocapsa sp.]
MHRILGLILMGILGHGSTGAATLEGTATWRERIALPEGTVLEVVIEDISRADAPAGRIASTVVEDVRTPPVSFGIDYDPAALSPRGVYAVRATLRRNAELLFTTDRITRVLRAGDPERVELMLRAVQSAPSARLVPGIGAHGLRLPATFRGTLPCADCPGVVHHLDLWPEQHYHMHREWLGGGDKASRRRDEVGRWYADPARGAIVLHGASEMPLFWQIKGADRLRQMDMQGNPIESDRDYDLRSDGALTPTELGGVFLLGMMTYAADAATFVVCLSGVRYPIAQEGDYAALERAYLDAQAAPGAPMLVHLEGGLAPRPAMEGPDRTSLIVERFIKVVPDRSCEASVSTASLTDTYWRLDALMGEAVRAAHGRREPHIVLGGAPDQRFRATVGCNQMIGGYALDGGALSFEPGAATRMACPPPLDQMERQLLEALAATRAFRLEGQRLVLTDADGRPVADLAAVYLR